MRTPTKLSHFLSLDRFLFSSKFSLVFHSYIEEWANLDADLNVKLSSGSSNVPLFHFVSSPGSWDRMD